MKKNDILENIWSENAISFMSVEHSSQKNVLHSLLARLINDQRPKCLLDYGCGDGRILKSIDSSISIDVHDVNEEMLVLAETNSSERISSYYINRNDIPDNMYDAVLLSMVLVCIDNDNEYISVLRKIKSSKTEKGKVYIAVTHPCFRDRGFSNFHTSLGNDQPFNYLDDGKPFNVYIEDKMPPSVAFTDFHWSLAFTLNKIIETGLVIDKMIETSDDVSHDQFNPQFSPYLVIIAK